MADLFEGSDLLVLVDDPEGDNLLIYRLFNYLKSAYPQKLHMESFARLCFEQDTNLYATLRQNSICTVLHSTMVEALPETVVAYLDRHASWIHAVADDQIAVKVLKGNGKYHQGSYLVKCDDNDKGMTLDKIQPEREPAGKPAAFDGLSFSVTLTQDQKNQKDSLYLPYWDAKETNQSPVISYYHEKVDDFDEEDPDADLEF